MGSLCHCTEASGTLWRGDWASWCGGSCDRLYGWISILMDVSGRQLSVLHSVLIKMEAHCHRVQRRCAALFIVFYLFS